MKGFLENFIGTIVVLVVIAWLIGSFDESHIENMSVDKFMEYHSINEVIRFVEEYDDPYYVLEELGEDREGFLLKMLDGYGPLEDKFYEKRKEGYEDGYDDGYAVGYEEGYDNALN